MNTEQDISILSDEDFLQKFHSGELFNLNNKEEENQTIQQEEVMTSSNPDTDIEKNIDEPVEAEDDNVTDPEENEKDDTTASQELTEVKETSTEDPVTTEFDYKAGYENLLKPFKAGGKTIEIKDPNELISLAQKGVHYTQKMQQIKPNLLLLKSLEDNGLLDQDKINFMIDLSKGNKQAIVEHIKNLGINPFDINTEENSYTPTNYKVDKELYDTDQTLQDYYSLPEGKEVIDTIVNWDDHTKQEIMNDPKILPALMEQVKNGEFKEIVKEVDRLKLVGTIPANTSMSNAYAMVARALNKLPTQNNSNNKVNLLQKVKKSDPLPNTDKVEKLNTLKTKKTSITSVDNILSLDDESFLKAYNKLKKININL